MVFVATVSVNSQKEFWSSRPVSRMEDTPFCINNFMRHAWFNKILAKFTYTDELYLLFIEKFGELIQMVRVWNYHTKELFFVV